MQYVFRDEWLAENKPQQGEEGREPEKSGAMARAANDRLVAEVVAVLDNSPDDGLDPLDSLREASENYDLWQESADAGGMNPGQDNGMPRADNAEDNAGANAYAGRADNGQDYGPHNGAGDRAGAAPDMPPDMAPEEIGRQASLQASLAPISPEQREGGPETMPPAVNARASLAMAGDAAGITETARLAKILNLPEAVLARQPEYLRREMLARALAKNPPLASWAAQNPLNAALARDNIHEANQVAENFAPLSGARKGWEERQKAFDAYPKDIKSLTDPFRNFYNGWLDLARGVLAAGKSTQDLAFGKDSASSRWFANWIDTLNSLEARTDEPASFGGRLARDVVRNVPQLGAQIATWLTAGPLAATGLSFTYIYGSDYEKLTAKGISPENAAFAGALDSGLQSILERIGIGSMLKSFGATGWRGILEAAGKAAVTEGITESAQHMPEYLTDWWAQSSLYADDLETRAKWTWDKAMDAQNLLQGTKDALYEGLVGSILGGSAGGVHSWINSDRPANPMNELARAMGKYGRKAIASLEFDRALDSALALAGKHKNDPEAARRLLKASMPENMRQAWLASGDVASLLAEYGQRPQELVQALGGDAQRINDCIDSGLPLPVDIPTLAASGLAERIRPALHMEADGPSLEQARQWSPEKALDDISRVLNQEDDLEDFTGGEMERQLAISARETHARQMRIRPHVSRMLKQMRDAGFTDLEARANAQLIESHALSMWNRYGADPAAALAKWNIVRADDPNGKLLGQAVLSSEASLIRIFKNRNVSTLPHESSHVFVDDLLGIVTDNGNTALELLDREFKALAGPDADFSREMAPRLEIAKQGDRAENLRQLARDLMAEAGDLDKSLKLHARDQSPGQPEGPEVLADGAVAAPLAGEMADPAGDNARLARISASKKSLARYARRAARHLDGLERAREDARLLALHAGLSEQEAADVINLAGDPDMGMANYERLQEAAAKSFAHYLKAGKAPNSALDMVFNRMRQWLTSLMARSQTLWPGVDPAISGVFDRLLATDRDIELYASVASANSTEADFTSNGKIGPEDRKELLLLLEKVRASSADKVLGAMRRKRNKFYKTRYKSIFAELGKDPFWLLAEKASFQKAEAVAILGIQASDALGALRRDFYREDAQSAEITAADAGFESAAQMMQSLHERLVNNNETRRNVAETMAMAELDAMENADTDKALALDAEAYGKYLDHADMAIARAIGLMRMKTREEAERWAENSFMPRQLVTSQAANLLADRPLRQITPASLRALLNRALKKRNEYLDSGKPADMMRALNALNDARVAAEMLNLHQSYRRKAEKIGKKAQKLARSRPASMAAAQTEALRKLLKAYNLGTLQAPEDLAYSRQDFASLVREIALDNESVGVVPSFPEWLMQLAHPATGIIPQGNDFVRFHDLTPGQMTELENLMDFLAHTGREMAMESKKSFKMKIANIAINAAAKMRALPPARKTGEAGHLFRWLSASVDQLLWQARKADGLENITGKNRPGDMEELVRRIYKADERVRGWTDKINRQMEPHFIHLRETREKLEASLGRQMRIRRADGSIIQPPRVWRDAHGQDYYSFEMILALALNCGNISNMQRIMGGYFLKYRNEMDGEMADAGQDAGRREGRGKFAARDLLTFDDLGYILGDELAGKIARACKHAYTPTGRQGLFSLADWTAIQGIWDSLDLLWPDTIRAHKKIFGFNPAPVPRESFRLVRDGKAMTFNGGYYPVAFDKEIDERVGAWTEKEDLLARNEARFSAPSARDGHTKNRVKGIPRLPLLLDPGIIARHVSEAAKFIEYGPIVRVFDRIIQNEEF